MARASLRVRNVAQGVAAALSASARVLGALGWRARRVPACFRSSSSARCSSAAQATATSTGSRSGMVGARELPRGEAPALHSTVERLAALAGVPKPQLYLLRRRLSARPVGGPRARGSASRSARGLLGAATPAELEGVLAHELAHIRDRDVLVQTLGRRVRGAIDRDEPGRRLAPARAAVRARARSRRRSSICFSRRSASSPPTDRRSSAAHRMDWPTR